MATSVDPLSDASRDEDFNCAFTGEVGVVILSNSKLIFAIETKDEDFAKAMKEYKELSMIWASYKRLCSDQECPICKRDEDKSEEDNGGNDNAKGDSDDNTRKRNKSSHHKKSSLYDKSVPYSYRKGYTWAGTTANKLMTRWQGHGQITITQTN